MFAIEHMRILNSCSPHHLFRGDLSNRNELEGHGKRVCSLPVNRTPKTSSFLTVRRRKVLARPEQLSSYGARVIKNKYKQQQ